MSATDDHVMPISVAHPDAPDLNLHLVLGACRLAVRPGAPSAWIEGAYRDPSGRLPLNLVQEGGTVRLVTEPRPEALWGVVQGTPALDLALGAARPFGLSLEGGASDQHVDLGGLPVTWLVLKQGAGRYIVDFSAPNPQPMSHLQVSAGAGEFALSRLANANCGDLVFEGGAVSYSLDFGGSLQRDCSVRISTGMSSVQLTVPASTAARVTTQAFLGGVDASGAWSRQEGVYASPAAVAGTTPLLRIQVTVALGSIRLSLTG